MDNGNYVEWPLIESCSNGSEYDPRFRPWFANTASQPKDTIIMIDTSLSSDSTNLAKRVAKKVLSTLTQ